VLAACVWWIYFDGVKAIGLRRDNLWSSFVWGYGHLLIFGGIAAAAVGVELAIEAAAHDQTLDGVERAILTGGMLAFLLAISAIHAISTLRIERVLVRRLIACAALAAVGLLGGGLAPLVVVALLAAIAAWLLLSEVAAPAASPVPASAATD
jgi:low temperature requirement protein LtrA